MMTPEEKAALIRSIADRRRGERPPETREEIVAEKEIRASEDAELMAASNRLTTLATIAAAVAPPPRERFVDPLFVNSVTDAERARKRKAKIRRKMEKASRKRNRR